MADMQEWVYTLKDENFKITVQSSDPQNTCTVLPEGDTNQIVLLWAMLKEVRGLYGHIVGRGAPVPDMDWGLRQIYQSQLIRPRNIPKLEPLEKGQIP